jgi:hypothetical protein
MTRTQAARLEELCGEHIDLGFEKLIGNYGFTNHGIEINEELLQIIFELKLKQGSIEQALSLKKQAKRLGHEIEAEIDEEVWYKDCLLNLTWGRTKLFEDGSAFYGEAYEHIGGFSDFKKALQEAYNTNITGGYINRAVVLETLAETHGVKLKLDPKLVEEGYLNPKSAIYFERSRSLKQFIEFAAEKNIKLDAENILQETSKRIQLRELGDGWKLERLESIAGNLNIELDLDEEVIEESLQKYYKRLLSEDRSDDYEDTTFSLIHGLEWGAGKRGIKLKADKRLMQESIQRMYDRFIEEEACYLTRERINDRVMSFIEYADKKSIKIKTTEFEQEGFAAEKTVDGIGVIINQSKFGEYNKFVLGMTPDHDLILIYDNRNEYHKHFRYGYGITPIGGGSMNFDPENKVIRVFGSSGDYSHEPRIITANVLSKAFPDFKLEIGR